MLKESQNEVGARPEVDRDTSSLIAPALGPITATAFGAEAKDLEALRDAVAEAAGVGAGLWLSYLGVFFYLAITVGSVTHRDLFFESPLKLPFLNVDLPLKAFFVLGPLLFLIVHAYVLLHFVLLAGKVGAFHNQVADDDESTSLRRRLPTNIFVQFLAGPREVRTGMVGSMLRLIAWITLVIGPIALLVLFQLQFLPYHDEPITWWHRLAILADLILLWTLWPSVAHGEMTWITWRDLRHGQVMVATLASLLPLLLVFTIATFPGEWLDEHVPSVRLVPTAWPSFNAQPSETAEFQPPATEEKSEENAAKGEVQSGKEAWSVATLWKSMEWSSLYELLVGGDPHPNSPWASLWSNRLGLPDLDAIDQAKFDTEAKIAASRATLWLRHRRLEGAVLLSADFRKVDFSWARLRHAQLLLAQLQGATFFQAELKDANLSGAHLEGARLEYAELQGANLNGAQLQGATLDGAQLQGANLDGAQLQGATLLHANLRGAMLRRAQLQGASLDGTDLQGAVLDGAQLQGASLDGAELAGASFVHVFVWRADSRKGEAEWARVVDPEMGAKYRCDADEHKFWWELADTACKWSAKTFMGLNELSKRVPEGAWRNQVLERIAILKPTKQVDEKSMAKRWDELAQPPLPDDVYLKTLGEIGCSEDGAPYVAHNLTEKLSSDKDLSKLPEAAALARAFSTRAAALGRGPCRITTRPCCVKYAIPPHRYRRILRLLRRRNKSPS